MMAENSLAPADTTFSSYDLGQPIPDTSHVSSMAEDGIVELIAVSRQSVYPFQRGRPWWPTRRARIGSSEK